jgi:hypothetical protein
MTYEDLERPQKRIEKITGANLFVEELDGVYMLYINKEQATPYLSLETMYLFLCSLVSLGYMRTGGEFTAEWVSRVFHRALNDGYFDRTNKWAYHPARLYQAARTTSFMLDLVASRR